MAQSTEKVVIIVEAKGATKAKRDIAGIGTASKNSSKSVMNFSRIIAGVVSVYALRQMGHLIDSWIDLENRIKLSTNSIKGFNVAFKSVQSIANTTRSDIVATAMAYNRAAISTEALGLRQRQLENIVRTVNQTLKISGSTAQEARASLIQFFQGMASGQLRGEEFRSVTEANIRLTKLLKDELAGGDLGLLREQAFSGQLTADRVTKALLDRTLQIDREFQKIGSKVNEVFVKFKNLLIVLAGEMNNNYKIASKLMKVFEYLKDNLGKLGRILKIVGAVLLPALTIAMINFMAKSPAIIILGIALAFNELYEKSKVFRMDMDDLNKTMKTFGTNVTGMLDKSLPGLQTWFNEFDLDTFIISFQYAFAIIYSSVEEIKTGLADLGRMIGKIASAFDQLSNTINKPARDTGIWKILETGAIKGDSISKIWGDIKKEFSDGDDSITAITTNLMKDLNSIVNDYGKDSTKTWQEFLDRNASLYKSFWDKLQKSKKMPDLPKGGFDPDNAVVPDPMMLFRNIATSGSKLVVPEIVVKKVTFEMSLDQMILAGFTKGFGMFVDDLKNFANNIGDITNQMLTDTLRATTDSFLDVTTQGLNQIFDASQGSWKDLMKTIGDSFKALAHQFAKDIFYEISKGFLLEGLKKIPGLDSLFPKKDNAKELIIAGYELNIAGATLGTSAGLLMSAAAMLKGVNLSFGGGEGVGSGPNFISALMGAGFMEGGGDANAGQPYIVGEKRPELFVPRTNGTIIPDISGLGKGGGDTVVESNIILDMNGVASELANSNAIKVSIANEIKKNRKVYKQILGIT